MPPKADPQPENTTNKKIGSLICELRSPGPKYKLKTLVGYQEHCLSKCRSPAYSFGTRHRDLRGCEVPGPKYLLAQSKHAGFSFGLVGKSFDTSCGPGPKYLLPSPQAPAFSIKNKPKYRTGCLTPSPYDVRLPTSGPTFYIGQRLSAGKCDAIPGPRSYNEVFVKRRVPMYSIGHPIADKVICRSPGPKYYPELIKPRPIFSFGTKHSECAPPYIVECDDQC